MSDQLLVLSLVLLRIAWQIRPLLSTCLVFWIAVFTIRATSLQPDLSYLLIAVPASIGAGLNAAVTLANNGKMPVISEGNFSGFSLWVKAKDIPNPKLLSLADRYPIGWIRFRRRYSGEVIEGPLLIISVGDILIFAPVTILGFYIVVKDLIRLVGWLL